MTKEKRAYKSLAMALAFQNAAEMIRGHGEEGFCFTDEALDFEYKKAVKKVFKKIDSLSIPYVRIYKTTGININTEDDNSLT